MELSEFKKIFRDEFQKIFQQQKIVGSVLIRGGHLVNVAQLLSMEGEEGDGRSTPIPVCRVQDLSKSN